MCVRDMLDLFAFISQINGKYYITKTMYDKNNKKLLLLINFNKLELLLNNYWYIFYFYKFLKFYYMYVQHVITFVKLKYTI